MQVGASQWWGADRHSCHQGVMASMLAVQGVWLRDFMFKRYAYDPARQFNHTVWDSPSLDKPSLS